MATIELPTGEVIEFDGNMSPNQLAPNLSAFQDKQKQNQPPTSWGDVATGAVKNLPSSTAQLGKDLVHPLMHPVDTAKSLYGVASGGVQKLIPGEQENEAQWDAVTSFFKDRYGGAENLKRTLMEDPAGFVADLSTVM